jgi:hypothetical protein
MKLEIMLDELIISGMSAADAQRLYAAIEGELARLFAEQGIPPALAQPAAGESGGNLSLGVDNIEAATAHATPGHAAGSSANAVGSAVAVAIYRRLGA